MNWHPMWWYSMWHLLAFAIGVVFLAATTILLQERFGSVPLAKWWLWFTLLGIINTLSIALLTDLPDDPVKYHLFVYVPFFVCSFVSLVGLIVLTAAFASARKVSWRSASKTLFIGVLGCIGVL